MTPTTTSALANVAGLVGLAALMLYVVTDRQVARRPPIVLGGVFVACIFAAAIRVVLLFNH